jgi:hypothetical protein
MLINKLIVNINNNIHGKQYEQDFILRHQEHRNWDAFRVCLLKRNASNECIRDRVATIVVRF